MGELLVADFHRKGLLDGRSLRLPTICVRPGKPNKAASTWASSIFREPLAGQEAVCPVSRDSAMYLLSPRRVVDALVHAMELPSEALGTTRHVNLPGTTYSVAEMVDALERVAGKTVTARIRWEPDAIIQKIVAGWPQRFATPRAERLGFKADASLDEIVRQHIDDELGGRIRRVSRCGRRYLGIDFSGNAQSWRPGRARNVWIAEAVRHDGACRCCAASCPCSSSTAKGHRSSGCWHGCDAGTLPRQRSTRRSRSRWRACPNGAR